MWGTDREWISVANHQFDMPEYDEITLENVRVKLVEYTATLPPEKQSKVIFAMQSNGIFEQALVICRELDIHFKVD